MTVAQIVALVIGVLFLNAVVWFILITWLRRKYPLPTILQKPDPISSAKDKAGGYYLMTLNLLNGVEKGRFLGWFLLSRGNGDLYLTDKGLHFLRRGTKRPIFIPANNLRGVNAEISHRLRIRGKLVLEVDWEVEGRFLRSVFVLSGGVSATRRVADWIEANL